MTLEMSWLGPDMMLQIVLDIYTSVWRDMQPVHSGIKGAIFIKKAKFQFFPMNLLTFKKPVKAWQPFIAKN